MPQGRHPLPTSAEAGHGPGEQAARARARARRRRGRLIAVGALALTIDMVGAAVAQTQNPRSGSLTIAPGRSASSASVGQLRDGVASVTFVLPGLPTGEGVYLGIDVRGQAGGSAYRGKVRVLPDGSLWVGAGKVLPGGELAFAGAPVPGRLRAGGRLQVDVRVDGGSHPRVATRAWVSGAAVPQWQSQTFDGGAPAILGPGGVRACAYLSGAATAPLTVWFQGLQARADQPSADPGPTAPAAGSPSATGGQGSGTSGTPGAPSAATTGVPAGTKLTVHEGDLTITRPGTVIDALDLRGFLEIRAANVTVRRSLIRGGVATGPRGVVQNNDPAAVGFLLEDSEIRPAHPSVWLTGVQGANFTMRRVHVNGGVVDGVMVSGDNARIQSSYIHGLVSYAVAPTHADGSHNDGVQVVGGRDITVTGNTIVVASGQNSVLQVTQDIGPTRRLTFTGNRVDGGTCSVKLTHQGGTTLGPITVGGNRFGRGMSIGGCAILRTGATSLSESGNVWADDGGPVVVRTYG